ncbi:hypothetical protein AN958_10280 [Leucoagaricus sp. SymC.cos]|nr:hypothetical protein AN958_10280 [Leucoagaricus sp. SymC.cos]
MYCPRPESPPPRAPSPPLLAFTPLPCPSSRANRKLSSSSSAPSLPPGLQQERTILTVRSYEHLSPRKAELAAHRQPKRIRSALGHTSSGVRTNSLPEPFTQPVAVRPHQRALSLTSRTSPPPSPKLQTPPPPVPPIPSFILTPADKKSSRSTDAVTPIYLPDIDPVSPITDLPASVLKSSGKAGLVKTRSAGMTCLKFFNLRNSLKSNRL